MVVYTVKTSGRGADIQPMRRGCTMPPAGDRRSAIVLTTIVGLWLSLVVVGFVILVGYSYGAGATVIPPASATTAAPSGDGRHTLVVVAHPKCPCTRATMSELDRLMATVHRDMNVRVLLYMPEDASESWTHGPIRSAALRLPNADVELDRSGRIAREFNAATSGHVVLIAPSGKVCFSGGLTSARGHEGASLGRRAIVAWIRTGLGETEAPVFGCALFAPDETGASTGGV